MIADAVTSIKAYLYEKAASPLLGSLIISWCAWNYKFLLMLVSGLSFPDKLRYINILYSNNYECYFQGMILPLVTSILYLFVFPFPAQFVYKFSLGKQKALNELKNKIQENELLTVEQSRAIRNQLLETEKHFEELIERKDRALENKDKEIMELYTNYNESKNEYETFKNKTSSVEEKDITSHSSKNELEENVIKWIKIGSVVSPNTRDEYIAKVLYTIYEYGGEMLQSEILGYFPDRTKAKYYVEDMTRNKLISYDPINDELSMEHYIKGIFIENM